MSGPGRSGSGSGRGGDRRRALLRAWPLALLIGCFASPERLISEGRIDEAISAIRAEPDGYRARYLLSRAYLAGAQRALEAGDRVQYAEQLATARKEALRAVQIAPMEPAGHNLLGMLAAYERDVPGARRSFDIARELDPEEPIYYLNLAELEICRGEFQAAQAYLDDASRLGGSAGLIQLAEALAAWRAGDLDTARSIVEPMVRAQPDVVRGWAGGAPILSFDDFVSYCSRLPFCDPARK
jgi:tetratricopeptide (TPR) repeat protein